MRWLLVVLAACVARPQPTMFVRDARLAGWNLSVETCEVFADHDKIQVRECATTMQALPVLTEPAPPAVSTTQELAKLITADVRDALEQCATGEVRLELTIGPQGISDVAPADIADCAGRALAAMRTPGKPQRVTLHVRGRR